MNLLTAHLSWNVVFSIFIEALEVKPVTELRSFRNHVKSEFMWVLTWGWPLLNVGKFDSDKGSFFLNNVVKRDIGVQLQMALDETDYLDLFQSGFRLGYNTEVTLIAPVYDIWRALNGIGAAILAFSNLSEALIIISHGILLNQHQGLGMGSTVLWKFSSFLHSLFQLVLIEEERSSLRHYNMGCFSAPVSLLFFFNTWNQWLRSFVGILFSISVCWRYSVIHLKHWMGRWYFYSADWIPGVYKGLEWGGNDFDSTLAK